MDTLVTRASRGATPLTLVTESDLEAWKKQASAQARRWVESSGFTAKADSHCLLPDSSGALSQVLAGCDPGDGLWASAALPSTLPAGRYVLENDLDSERASDVALGWALGSYHFARYKSGQGPTFATLVWPKGADRKAVEGTARAIALVRDLITTPANDMGPAALAQAARRLARDHKAKCSVILGDRLLKANYPAVHAVGRASDQAPRLVDLRWGSRGPRVTLVGKGVCFDSGGLDLKTAAGMKLMKKDMGGAAHVLGLAQMIMAAGLKVRLRVLVPAVENSVSDNAFRPSDVIGTRKGLTVEVGNTDAEGRLILCDALAEADREKPDLLLDFATLTGAARVALGTELPALFTDHDWLADALVKQGQARLDPLWRLPLHAPYRRLLNSKVADINNISEGGYGGAITAALFLKEFVRPETPWAHIDLMAYNLSAKPGRPVGGEAMGLRATFAVIADLAQTETKTKTKAKTKTR